MPDSFKISETDGAVEKLLIEKNGAKKTVTDVFEVLIAIHHDSKKRDARIMEKLDSHLYDYVHLSRDDFEQLIGSFDERHEMKDEMLNRIEAELREDIEIMKENCVKIHAKPEDAELGDLRRAWKVVRWGVLVIGGAFLVAFGNELSQLIFH